jgi:outer membrane receptor protein involved in Fe transport
MTPRLDAHLEFSTTSAIATRNMSISSTQAVPATAPSNPFTTAVTVYLPIDGFWPVWSDNVTRRFVAGFTYKLPHQWTAQGDYSWTRGTNSFYSASSTLATADITNDLNSGKLNPFLDTTLHRFDLQPYSGTQSYFGPASTNNVALRASGPVWRLPAGAPTVTVGLETRQEGYGNAHTYITYPNFPARDTYSVAIGKRQSTRSAYTEVQAPVVGESNRLPLVYQLDFQAAGRAEDFTVRSGTSSINVLPAPATAPVILNNTATYRSNNPTAGLRYRPVDSLMFRVSHARGFVAPSYSQLALNTIPAATPTTIADPRRGGLSYPVSTVSGGNPDLTPERSQSWNLGLVFDPRSGPLKGLRASVEYYVIRKQNNIGALSAQTLIENESLFPDRITRSAPPAGDPFGVGPITLVNTASLNLLKSFLEGFDFNLTYRRDTARFGNFLLSALASMPNHVKRKTTFGQPYLDYANYVSQGQIRLNGNASLSWDWRQWSAGWTTRYVSRFLVPAPPVSTSTASITSQGGRYVPAQSYSDVFVAYRFHGRGAAAASRLRTHVLRDTEIQFGVSNLFKKTPPYDVASFGSYYYSTWGDIRWRDLRLSLKRTF